MSVAAQILVATAACSSDSGGPKEEASSQSTAARPTTGDEYLSALAGCLNDAGWDAVIERDGGMSVDSVTAEQRTAFMAAQDSCKKELGPPPQEAPLTDSEIGRIYDYYVGELTDCVVGLGYPVGEPPSRESFVANYYAPDAGLWSPYDVPAASLTTSEEDWMQLNEKCPQGAPESR